MKKRILLITLIGMSFGIKAQNIFPTNGNVGIGTNTPAAKLDLRGTMYIETNSDAVFTFNNTDNSWQYFQFKQSGIRKTWMGLNAENDFCITKDNGGDIVLGGANVGIGTYSPEAKLEIESSGAVYTGTPTLLVKDLSNRGTMFLESVTDNPTDFVFKNNGEGRVWLSSRNSSSGYEFNIYTNPDGVGGPEKMAMTIKQNGNIGIGISTTGTHKLAVDGTIGAREIVVETGAWSDFVFNKDYELKDLEEVESFIEENNHLPDIPSEKEVLENGIQVGEMNAKLLQKIEELTLYMIQMNKDVTKLKKENTYLKKKIETL